MERRVQRRTGFSIEDLVSSIEVQTLPAPAVMIEPAYDRASGEWELREMVANNAEDG